jgi:hypothetical protein
LSSPSSIKWKKNINQNQTVQHPELLACGKPPHAALHWEKLVPFLPACLSTGRKNRWAPCTLWDSPTTPGNINQCSPWEYWSPLPELPTKLKNKQWTAEGEGKPLNCPQERGWNKELNSQCWTLSEQTQQQAISQSRVGSGLQSWSPEPEGSTQNQTSPPCWERSWPNSWNWRITQLLLGKTTAPTSLYDLANLPHLTISIKLVDRVTKHYSQASHLVRPYHSFCLYASTRTGCQRSNSRT